MNVWPSGHHKDSNVELFSETIKTTVTKFGTKVLQQFPSLIRVCVVMQSVVNAIACSVCAEVPCQWNLTGGKV